MPNENDYLADLLATFVDQLTERPSHEGYDPDDYGLTTEQAAAARLRLQPELMKLARHIRAGAHRVAADDTHERCPECHSEETVPLPMSRRHARSCDDCGASW